MRMRHSTSGNHAQMHAQLPCRSQVPDISPAELHGVLQGTATPAAPDSKQQLVVLVDVRTAAEQQVGRERCNSCNPRTQDSGVCGRHRGLQQ